MKITKTKWLSCAVAVFALTATAVPSHAFTSVPSKVVVTSDVTDVQYRPRRGFYRDRGVRYYNGYRGYRYQRPGYRYHRGWWFPLAAFGAGAIIGGAIAQPPVRYGNRHVEWCYNRYRSYRAYDNTYQPYNGPRRQCYSPYS